MRFFKLLFLLNFFIINLVANVNIQMEDKIIKGEPLVFTVEIFGNDVKFPDLNSIDGNLVQENGSSISTKNINGKISKYLKKSYFLFPKKDFIFPSLEFEIDDKKYTTNEKKITLINPSKTKSDLFDFEIQTSKNSFFVGENFVLTLNFKYKKNMQILDLSLNKPNFESFWYKQIDEPTQKEDDEFKYIQMKFLMASLKEGVQNIAPLMVQIQVLDETFNSFFSNTKNLKIYSNELNFDIKSLPQNIKLIGSFEVDSNIDKQQIKKGEAISYKLKIEGLGNIDDISDIKLPLDNLTIYENKPQIKAEIKNGEYGGVFEKVFSIVPNKSFVIPSINFEYFDKDLQKIVTKTTKSYEIDVLEEEIKKEVVLEKKEEIKNEEQTNQVVKIVEKSSLFDKIIFFCLGIIFSLLVGSLYFYVITSKQKKEKTNTPLIKKIKTCNTKEELLKILAIYIKVDKRLDELIFLLEKAQDIKSLKKEIIEILKELNL